MRSRDIDITDVRADLRFDLGEARLTGTLAVTFTPLREGLREVSLDAAEMTISAVESGTPSGPVSFVHEGRALTIKLPSPLSPGETGIVKITYACQPRTGMYFIPAVGSRSPQAWNYGEGGLHYSWLPLYNDTNERFTATFAVTVARPFVALSNGRLEATLENADGTRTFRWVQDTPVPNYLLTVDVGAFTKVPLAAAHLPGRDLPLSVWGEAGSESALALTFGKTPEMVEFFSQRFGYAYPWAKYDQVVLREFATGAMETTTMVGFTAGHVHQADDPPDTAPNPESAHPTWTSDDTIAHELAHHWFGDLVTCRSLGSIWLNESFASFAHTVWNGHENGEDDLTYQRWRYLDSYLGYVGQSGRVRPMEFLRYTVPDAVYQLETTYLKGALVLHMLRRIVGDEDFYRTLAWYLHRNEFRSVESSDLLAAFKATTGRNLTWFFDDWIVGGGGHPSFEVSYQWVPERMQVDLTVKQVQADLPFENAFRLPVEIEIVTASGPKTHTVEVDGWTTRLALPADSKPLAVVFDKGGWLVADVRFERSLDEWLYQLAHGGLAEQLRAARQLGQEFRHRREAVSALVDELADKNAHWGLRQEAARGLGLIGDESAAKALIGALRDPDRRVRRGVAVALAGGAGGREADEALKAAVTGDPAEDVVAAAAASLGRRQAPGAREFLAAQVGRGSRWWDVIRAGALTGLSEFEDASLVATFARHVDATENIDVRLAALKGWARAAPEDRALAGRLRDFTRDPNRNMQLAVIDLLAGLHRSEDAGFFRDLSGHPDAGISQAARDAAEGIEAFKVRSQP